MSIMKDLISQYVGKKAYIQVGGLTTEVVVKDVKVSYGHTRFLVTPVSGNGEQWVESVALKKGKKND